MDMKKNLLFLYLLLLGFSNFNILAQSCTCTEYLYLNEATQGGKVHKYSIASDGTLTELINNSNAWYPGNSISEMPFPHGLGSDLNGYLYISEGFYGNVRRLTCDGEIIPASEFIITDGGTNITTVGNTLYINTTTGNGINAYDLCTGNLIGSVCLNGLQLPEWADWGFYIDDNGTFYITEGQYESNAIWIFTPTEADFNNGTCFNPVTNFSANPNGLWGITTDPLGNIYIVAKSGNPSPARIYKFDSNLNLLTSTNIDNVDGDGGFYNAIGIIYSETCNCLYVSTQSLVDDCVSQFDLNLNYQGAAVPASNNATEAKGLSILKECCPNPTNLVIDTIFCASQIAQEFNLRSFLDCDGVVCEGIWQPNPNNQGLAYEECTQAVRITSDEACGTFTLSSEGNEPTQCGTFSITLNIEVLINSMVSISGAQTICEGDIPNILTATSSTIGIDYQWQMSQTNCTDGFTDIEGATSSTYQPSALSSTTYYRVKTSLSGNCATGNCSETSNCVTVMTESCSVPALRLSKKADAASVSLGDPVTFTLTVYNDGTEELTNIEVTDILPIGLTYTAKYCYR